MPEETKEEYIVRHRKSLGMMTSSEIFEEKVSVKKPSIKERLSGAMFLLGFVLFLLMILKVFGMMNSN